MMALSPPAAAEATDPPWSAAQLCVRCANLFKLMLVNHSFTPLQYNSGRLALGEDSKWPIVKILSVNVFPALKIVKCAHDVF